MAKAQNGTLKPKETSEFWEEHSKRGYQLDEQVGFILRRAHQRASAIFSSYFKNLDISPVQFSVLEKIHEQGRVSQNQLGRMVHMDPATIMGVINRLASRELVRRWQDPNDRRKTLLSITSAGLKLIEECEGLGLKVSAETLAPLNAEEQATFLALLGRLT